MHVPVMAGDCRDKNVIVPWSERVNVDQNGSEPDPGKRLMNHVEGRIFITSQNTSGDLQAGTLHRLSVNPEEVLYPYLSR
jgi:hypothetical protein